MSVMWHDGNRCPGWADINALFDKYLKHRGLKCGSSGEHEAKRDGGTEGGRQGGRGGKEREREREREEERREEERGERESIAKK
jgi:hypothetical protein